jgi:hypothetical protein
MTPILTDKQIASLAMGKLISIKRLYRNVIEAVVEIVCNEWDDPLNTDRINRIVQMVIDGFKVADTELQRQGVV